jgi:hypothetical protein
MVLRIFKLVPLAVLVMLLLAPGAQAGSYHVYTCRTPAGEAAPADGWSGSVAAGGAYDDYAKNRCAEHGALIAALGDQTSHFANVDRATWALEVPSTDRMLSATLWRAGYLHGSAGETATYQFWLAAPTENKIFDECLYTLECHGQGDISQPMSNANRVVVPSANLGAHLFVNVSCGAGMEGSECKGGFGDPYGYAAVVYLYAADLVLEQTAGPSASNVNGELASASSVSGTSDITFNASDPGSGVYEAVFSIDGQVLQSTVINENGGRCKNVGQTSDGLPAFLYVQPCLASVSADVGFDTTRVSNGSHHLVVSVIDAAGNSSPVLDRNVVVANPTAPAPAGGSSTSPSGAAGGTIVPTGAPNGTNASEQATLTVGWTATRRARLTSRYGRTQTIAGRLTGPGGVPIAGAQIDLAVTPAYAGAQTATMPSPHTGPDGRFTVRLPGGVCSRTLRFTYRAHTGDVVPVATRTLSLSVSAAIALSISPRTASVGRSIYFRGRLLGGPIPRGGKQLVLEARSPGGSWIEFKVIRAGAGGRYRASYRFRFPGPAHYQFRVLSEAEADYPFAAGASNVVRVFEG